MQAGLHFDVHDGDGEPMLLVHGILGGRGLWAANLADLRSVCSPVVVELFGHGRSPSPAELNRYHPDAYVAELERIRTDLDIDRWWVTGQSLGAAITLRYCLDHPARVRGHVFTNSASGLADDDWLSAMRATAERDAAAIEREGHAGLPGLRMNPARSRRIVAEVRDALVLDESLLDPVGIAHGVRATATSASVRHRISENTVPTMLVVGTAERGFAEASRHAGSVMPHLRVEAVPAGHSPNAELPVEFNRLVSDFVRSCP